jgi:DNA-directed RNA polymerase beta' subunit
MKTMYKCNSCGGNFEAKDTHMDHIESVIDVQVGFVDWNTYISRLFVDVDGYQLLCSGCHLIKTTMENEMRREFKKKLDKGDSE